MLTDIQYTYSVPIHVINLTPTYVYSNAEFSLVINYHRLH